MYQHNHSRSRPRPQIRPDLVGILLLSINIQVAAEDMDEALRGRDMGKVLEMLTPSTPDPEPSPEHRKSPPPKTTDKNSQKHLPKPSQPISSPSHVDRPHIHRPVPSISDMEQTARVTRISHILPSDLAGLPPHRVTVVSSGSILRDREDEPTSTNPSEQTILPPPSVTTFDGTDLTSPRSVTNSGSPIRVGVRSELPDRVPKIQKGQVISPPILESHEILETRDQEPEVTILASLPPTTDKPDRNKALGTLQSLQKSVVIVQTNSFIPDGTPVAEPPAMQQLPGTKGAKQAELEDPERPLHLLDVLAKRFGRAPSKRSQESLKPSTHTRRQLSTSTPKEAQPTTQSHLSANWRSNEMEEIRDAIDKTLVEADRNPARQTERSNTKPSSVDSPAHTGQGWRYLGDWRNGKMDGSGTLTYPDGWTFDGEWREGKMHGEGTLTHPGGWVYQGEWSAGTMDGEGILTYPDGWQYIGEWRAGRMHGTGELLQADYKKKFPPNTP